jgi:hypothetical protein
MAVVLIVEDEARVVMFAESYLQERGHQKFSASSVEQATAILESSERIDVLFTDIALKDDHRAGFELTTGGGAVSWAEGAVPIDQTVTDAMRALFVEGLVVFERPYNVDMPLESLSDLDA